MKSTNIAQITEYIAMIAILAMIIFIFFQCILGSFFFSTTLALWALALATLCVRLTMDIKD